MYKNPVLNDWGGFMPVTADMAYNDVSRYETTRVGVERKFVPVTSECVVAAGNHYGVSPAVILSVLTTEGGKIGQTSKNKNGTFDIGPMQINSIHLPSLSSYGITLDLLRDDGCLNVHIGTWMLKKEILSANGSVWDGIGHYHSRTPEKKKIYQSAVWKKSQILPEEWKKFDCNSYGACGLRYER